MMTESLPHVKHLFARYSRTAYPASRVALEASTMTSAAPDRFGRRWAALIAGSAGLWKSPHGHQKRLGALSAGR